jgi:hypothetical protein
MNASVLSSSRVGSLPALLMMRLARPLGCSSRAFSRCSLSTICSSSSSSGGRLCQMQVCWLL